MGAFLRRANAGKDAATAASLEGDLHLDENGQIIRPAARADEGSADPADAMHDIGTFAQVRAVCALWRRSPGADQPAQGPLVARPEIHLRQGPARRLGRLRSLLYGNWRLILWDDLTQCGHLCLLVFQTSILGLHAAG